MASLALLFTFSSLVLFLSWNVTRHHHVHSHVNVDGDAASAMVTCLVAKSLETEPIFPAIFTPRNATFSSVLRAYIRNARFDTSETPKPVLIVTPRHVSHIQASVLCANSLRLHLRIRSGGHDYEAVSYTAARDPHAPPHAPPPEPFVLLDISELRSVAVDEAAGTAWVEAGATLGELFHTIAMKSRALAFPAGVCPTVGVGGHFSGAGYGNLMRRYGVTADHITDAVVVDVSGRILDREAMGEDLFWAIRGGGAASFVVVAAFKINLVRIPETVSVFSVTKTGTQNASIAAAKWHQIANVIDEDLFIRFVMHLGDNNNVAKATFVGMFLGDANRLSSLINQTFPELGLSPLHIVETTWTQSVFFWANIPLGTPDHDLLSRNTAAPVPRLKRKSDYTTKPISRRALESIFEKMISLRAPINVTFNPYGGEMARVDAAATPFPHRAGVVAKVQYAVNWKEEGDTAAEFHIRALREVYEFMTPYVSEKPRLAYFNYKDLDLGINSHGKRSFVEGKSYGERYFLGNFERLVDIKTRVDPQNFFRNEHSIPVRAMCFSVFWSFFSFCL